MNWHSIRTIRILLTLLIINNVKGSLRRIYTSREDINSKFPFIVVIDKVKTNSKGVNVSEPMCMGSLVTESWVLTAASCLQDDISIRHGSSGRSNLGGSVYGTILKKIKHPGALAIDFTQNNNKLSKKMVNKNNIGLINVEGVNRPSVTLHATDYQSLFGVPVTTVAFSSTKRRYFKMSEDYLRNVDQGQGVVIKCEGIDGDINPAVCIGKKCDEGREIKRPAPADVGGPLMYGDRLLGVCSFSSGSTTAYTPVSPYLEWIHDVVMNISKTQPSAQEANQTETKAPEAN